LHRGADPDDAALVQVAQERLRDIRNIARDFLGTQLGIAGIHFELLDVDRSVVVVLHQALRDDDRVFEVITAPWHEGYQNVAAQSQLAQLRAWTVRQNITLLHPLPLVHDGLLADTGVLVRALKLGHRVNVRADFARHLTFVDVTLHADDDAFA